MVSKKKRGQSRNKNGGTEHEKENDGGGVADYEQSREQRIKENLQRMQKLGILELSRNLKPPQKPKAVRPQKKSLPPPPGSPRRSSRLKTLPAVSYVEKRVPNAGEKVVKVVKIEIKEGKKPEIYTEEHEKVLGDHKKTWTLMVDGYDDEGNRMYDEYVGKSCHQCRQKTLGYRTKCSKCKAIQGQVCGDCLFMRYGENVLEANANPDWVCPVCRDICNCSRCRRVKGWEPTGNIYRKALHLGYKSVAHYLIHTRGPHGNQEEIAGENSGSEEDSILPTVKEAEVSSGNNTDKMDEVSKSQSLSEKDIKHHDRDLQSNEDDSNLDPDYNSDPVNEDDDDDDHDHEDDSSEED